MNPQFSRWGVTARRDSWMQLTAFGARDRWHFEVIVCGTPWRHLNRRLFGRPSKLVFCEGSKGATPYKDEIDAFQSITGLLARSSQEEDQRKHITAKSEKVEPILGVRQPCCRERGS